MVWQIIRDLLQIFVNRLLLVLFDLQRVFINHVCHAVSEAILKRGTSMQILEGVVAKLQETYRSPLEDHSIEMCRV
jgi:hypothetical protein